MLSMLRDVWEVYLGTLMHFPHDVRQQLCVQLSPGAGHRFSLDMIRSVL